MAESTHPSAPPAQLLRIEELVGLVADQIRGKQAALPQNFRDSLNQILEHQGGHFIEALIRGLTDGRPDIQKHIDRFVVGRQLVPVRETFTRFFWKEQNTDLKFYERLCDLCKKDEAEEAPPKLSDQPKDLLELAQKHPQSCLDRLAHMDSAALRELYPIAEIPAFGASSSEATNTKLQQVMTALAKDSPLTVLQALQILKAKGLASNVVPWSCVKSDNIYSGFYFSLVQVLQDSRLMNLDDVLKHLAQKKELQTLYTIGIGDVFPPAIKFHALLFLLRHHAEDANSKIGEHIPRLIENIAHLLGHEGAGAAAAAEASAPPHGREALKKDKFWLETQELLISKFKGKPLVALLELLHRAQIDYTKHVKTIAKNFCQDPEGVVQAMERDYLTPEAFFKALHETEITTETLEKRFGLFCEYNETSELGIAPEDSIRDALNLMIFAGNRLPWPKDKKGQPRALSQEETDQRKKTLQFRERVAKATFGHLARVEPALFLKALESLPEGKPLPVGQIAELFAHARLEDQLHERAKALLLKIMLAPKNLLIITPESLAALERFFEPQELLENLAKRMQVRARETLIIFTTQGLHAVLERYLPEKPGDTITQAQKDVMAYIGNRYLGVKDLDEGLRSMLAQRCLVYKDAKKLIGSPVLAAALEKNTVTEGLIAAFNLRAGNSYKNAQFLEAMKTAYAMQQDGEEDQANEAQQKILKFYEQCQKISARAKFWIGVKIFFNKFAVFFFGIGLLPWFGCWKRAKQFEAQYDKFDVLPEQLPLVAPDAMPPRGALELDGTHYQPLQGSEEAPSTRSSLRHRPERRLDHFQRTEEEGATAPSAPPPDSPTA